MKPQAFTNGGCCNVADFYHVTFAFRRADFYNKIPSIGSQEENPSPQRSESLVFLYYLLILFVIFFSCERKLCDEQKTRRRTGFQLATFPSALSICRLIVGRFAITTTPPSTLPEDHRLQLGPFAEAMYYFCCLSELINLSNFAFILPLPLVKLH